METGVYLNMELPQHHVGDDAAMEEYLGRASPWLPALARWRLVVAVKTYFWGFRWSEIRPFTIQDIKYLRRYIYKPSVKENVVA